MCPAEVFTLGGDGRWPGAIFFMEGGGIRPTVQAMAERLAHAGYVVLLPDLYYRAGPYAPLVPTELFTDGTMRAVAEPLLATTGNKRGAADSAAFLDYLASRADATTGKVGVVGYRMSGAIALTVAATYPDRVGAVASFHGGILATDADDSPHRLAAAIRARVYIAGAEADASYPPEMARVDYRSETYAGARHGWTMANSPSTTPRGPSATGRN